MYLEDGSSKALRNMLTYLTKYMTISQNPASLIPCRLEV